MCILMCAPNFKRMFSKIIMKMLFPYFKVHKVIKMKVTITCYLSSQGQPIVYILPWSLWAYLFLQIHISCGYCFIVVCLSHLLYRSHTSKHFDALVLFMSILAQALGITTANLYLFQPTLLFSSDSVYIHFSYDIELL